jgi:hypothetical protein
MIRTVILVTKMARTFKHCEALTQETHVMQVQNHYLIQDTNALLSSI